MIWVFFITPKLKYFGPTSTKQRAKPPTFPICAIFFHHKKTQNPNLSKLGKRVGNDCPSFPCIAYSHGFYEQNPKEHRLMMGWQERRILLEFYLSQITWKRREREGDRKETQQFGTASPGHMNTCTIAVSRRRICLMVGFGEEL